LLAPAFAASLAMLVALSASPAPNETSVGGVRKTPLPEAKPRTERTGKVTIAATGDLAMGREGVLPPDGGTALFASAKRHLAGDVVLANLETALATGGASKCGAGSDSCFAFRAPPAYARLLRRAGFTVLNLANNHSYDYGPQGALETVAALDRVGLGHTGRPGEIAFERVGRARIAILGFAPYPWAQNLLDIPGAERLVRKADRAADLVVVTMHAGAEGAEHAHVVGGPETYLGEPRGDVVAFAHALVDAGADVVVGHGPHVLRGMEWYRRRLIAYSLGDFSGHHNFSLAGPLAVSGVLRVTLRADGSWVRGKLVATRLVGSGMPVLDPTGEAHELVRRLSREDFGSRAVRISRTGRLLAPA
jgi:Bacterial capsule synthesis protein PGA_cap